MNVTAIHARMGLHVSMISTNTYADVQRGIRVLTVRMVCSTGQVEEVIFQWSLHNRYLQSIMAIFSCKSNEAWFWINGQLLKYVVPVNLSLTIHNPHSTAWSDTIRHIVLRHNPMLKHHSDCNDYCRRTTITDHVMVKLEAISIYFFFSKQLYKYIVQLRILFQHYLHIYIYNLHFVFQDEYLIEQFISVFINLKINKL